MGSLNEKRSRFLERYLERQSEIEGLLDTRWCGNPEPTPSLRSILRKGRSATDLKRWHTEDLSSMDQDAADAEETPGHNSRSSTSFDVVHATPNTMVEGDVLVNEEWSGGVVFAPPSNSAFELEVCPLGPPETHPFFIGIAPADVDLSALNVFEAENCVFLCIGGVASESLIAALGAPGGPAFHALGVRSVAELPVTLPGHTVAVQYSEHPVPGREAMLEGRVSFVVRDDQGDGGGYRAEPRLWRRLPAGGWRPVLLLCMPDTHIRVMRLS